MSRCLRFILMLGVLAVCTPVARGEDRSMSQLAQRLTSPGSSLAASLESDDPVENVAVDVSALEDRPLGATQPVSNKKLTGPGSLDAGGSWLMSTLTSLGLVIGLVLVGRWAWGRFGGQVKTKPNAVVEVLSRTSIAPRNHVLLLRVGSRILIVSESSTGGTRTLAQVDDPHEVADLIEAVTVSRDNSISKSFTRLLQGYNGEHDSHQQIREEGGDHGEFKLDHARNSVSSLLSRIRLMKQRGDAL